MEHLFLICTDPGPSVQYFFFKILFLRNLYTQGRLGGTAVKRLPSAQGMIPAFRKGVPHQAPPLGACFFISQSPACVPSLAGCLSVK